MNAVSARRVLVTGGAGYVGSALVPRLLELGYDVTVLDLYLYGEHVLDSVKNDPKLTQIKGDMRDRETVRKSLAGATDVIHLACISNDPSFELNPDLGRSINYECFPMLLEEAKTVGVSRFVYASSASVYGVREEEQVTESLAPRPLTDYSKYKAMCEEVLISEREPGFSALIVRPATVCGYAPRLRLDLTVNILTNHAVNNRKIRVFGGEQTRPSIHMDDMVAFYLNSLKWPAEKIDGGIYNVGGENRRVRDLADDVRAIVGDDVTIEVEHSDDNRSYRVSSEKIRRELGFEDKRSLKDAIQELTAAFNDGQIPNSMSDPRYYNIKTMQLANLR